MEYGEIPRNTSSTPTGIGFAFNADNFVSLTDMYAKAVAAGKAGGKSDPSEWKVKAGKTFIFKLSQKLNTAIGGIYKTVRGKVDTVMTQRGLVPKRDSLRDNLSHTELVRITLAESMAADAIEGGSPFIFACTEAARVVARTQAA